MKQKLMRPGPSEIVYKNMRFLIMDRPTDATIAAFIESDTMASFVSADPTRALQGTNRGSGPAMEESENDVGSLEQLFLYADEHYLAGKLPLGDHLGTVLHGVKEYHQGNVGP
ncbi:15-hydroxyprostaglandin dehydrogenase [Trichonephila clavipes]|nr:15-hydroxyprostaglandin dehydrogenase [Trichonephila clavipes]